MPNEQSPELADPQTWASLQGNQEWPLVRLGEYVTKLGSGSTPKGGEAVYLKAGVPLIRSMNVHFDGLRTEGLVFIDQSQANKLQNVVVEEGDVLLNITGASIGRTTTAPRSMSGARVNQHVCIIRPTAEFLPKFLSYFFASPQEQQRIRETQVGATRQALTKRMIEGWQIPMPPLNIQRLLVAEIEKQMTRLEAGKTILRRASLNIKRYKAAVLRAATGGFLVPNEVKLAESEGRSVETGEDLLSQLLISRRQAWEGRGKYKEPSVPVISVKSEELPIGWAWASVEQVGYVQPGRKRTPKTVSRDHPTPYIRAANITNTGLDLTNVLQMEFSPREREQYALKEGDIVLAEASGSASQVGKPALWKNELPLCCFQNTVIRFRTFALEPRFPFLVFRHYYLNGVFGQIAGGIGINHLGADKFSASLFPLPPIAEQRRIAAEVDRRLSVVEELETIVSANLQRANSLQKALLAHAFNQVVISATANVKPLKQPIRTAGLDGSVPLIMSSAKRATKESLAQVVQDNGGTISPQGLCLACRLDDDVATFFELLRECRAEGLLVVPAGKNAMITVPKP
jgi:type I restriction enzyme S subunit